MNEIALHATTSIRLKMFLKNNFNRYSIFTIAVLNESWFLTRAVLIMTNTSEPSQDADF